VNIRLAVEIIIVIGKCHRCKNVFKFIILVTFLRFLTFFIVRTFSKITKKNVENLLSMQDNSDI